MFDKYSVLDTRDMCFPGGGARKTRDMWYLDVNSEKTDFLMLYFPYDIH